jgi:hypothetical protein
MSETYPYEQLDGRRFQRLVQTLLTTEYPGIQCLPLSGPDGGRDAIQAEQEGDKLVDALIFQVKFREAQPLGVPTNRELYQWLTRQLTLESVSLDRLKERGATKYMVITNIKGTGGLDGGLRDKIKDWAEEHLPLPTTFWWRDDLDARLPLHYDLVFRFGLFTGIDSVRTMLEARYANKQASDATIKQSETPTPILALMSYLADQYRIESKLRFEQADLPGSPLLDLFVDVPVAIRGDAKQKRSFQSWVQSAFGPRAAHALDYDDDYVYDPWSRYAQPAPYNVYSREPALGGADLILADEIPKPWTRLVIEGAPGQGKSTLGQYVSQVHRMRLLDNKDDQAKLPERHTSSPMRLPIRIEFRHLATWFTGKNPWTSADVSKDQPQDYWAKSLESFIAAHVRHSSGGMAFTPDDIVGVLARTPSFIFLDGLDEVADIKLRQTIVEAVEGSLARLEAVGADMAVLVTSRPAIFLKAPGFSRKGFQYLQLASLTKPLITKYTESWLELRELPEEEAAEIVQVLQTSIEQTHVAELARNPMQLAILLWLISIKGRSLPDERTALYDQYLTAFLDREAKKSVAVRTHRNRLLELHGFLGWVLHARAESRDPRYAGGDITEDELRSLWRSYLIHEERSTDLVDELLEGAERVFVLVSRIEGKFEFEVQPLREFFAARYLYKTAPHSTAAFPAPGARPDRVHQLIRNPYWLNVARFFCGWYDKGELADLARHLKDLCVDPDFRLIGHPRYLIAYILQDCTTAESQRDTRELVTAMSDALGLRLLTSDYSSIRRPGSGAAAELLPPDCGLNVFVECLREGLIDAKVDETVLELARAIRENDSPRERSDWWLRGDTRWSRQEWLRRGIEIDAVAHVPLMDALGIFDPAISSNSDWVKCVEAGRFDVGMHDEHRLEHFSKAIGDGFAPVPYTSKCPDAGRLWNLPTALGANRFLEARHLNMMPILKLSDDRPVSSESVKDAVQTLDELTMLVSSIGGTRGPRNTTRNMLSIIDAARGAFGDSWLIWRLALIGGTSPGYSVPQRISFVDTRFSPMTRARSAKLSASSVGFWMEAASEESSSLPAFLAMSSALFAWADPEVLIQVLPEIADTWTTLEPYDVYRISGMTRRLMSVSGVGRNAPRNMSSEVLQKMDEVPASMLCLLFMRTTAETGPLLKRRILSYYGKAREVSADPHVSIVSSTLIAYTLGIRWRDKWPERLAEVRSWYSLAFRDWPIVLEEGYGFLRSSTDKERLKMASMMLASPNEYPARLLQYADSEMSSMVAIQRPPLRDIAIDEGWFGTLPI